MSEPLANYIRFHRKKAGLSQCELGKLLGYDDSAAVSKHEYHRSLPPLVIAIGYCVTFSVPLSELFAGLHQAVERVIEARLAELQQDLQDRGDQNPAVARKLRWISERCERRASSNG